MLRIPDKQRALAGATGVLDLVHVVNDGIALDSRDLASHTRWQARLGCDHAWYRPCWGLEIFRIRPEFRLDTRRNGATHTTRTATPSNGLYLSFKRSPNDAIVLNNDSLPFLGSRIPSNVSTASVPSSLKPSTSPSMEPTTSQTLSMGSSGTISVGAKDHPTC